MVNVGSQWLVLVNELLDLMSSKCLTNTKYLWSQDIRSGHKGWCLDHFVPELPRARSFIQTRKPQRKSHHNLNLPKILAYTYLPSHGSFHPIIPTHNSSPACSKGIRQKNVVAVLNDTGVHKQSLLIAGLKERPSDLRLNLSLNSVLPKPTLQVRLTLHWKSWN